MPEDRPASLERIQSGALTAPAFPTDVVRLHALERTVRRALERAPGTKPKAARLPGVSQRKVYRRMERFGLTSARRGSGVGRGAQRGEGNDRPEGCADHMGNVDPWVMWRYMQPRDERPT
jgi:hypothetical protein